LLKFENKIEKVDQLNKKIDKLRPFSSSLLKQIKEYYRIGLVYSSNALEGNTLTETETKIIIEDGLTIAGKPLRDHYEATGHSEAFDFIYSLVKKKTITEKDILKIHRLFYYRIDKKNSGQYRKVPVIITGTKYLPPSPNRIPLLMKSFCKKIPQLKKTLHPIECAANLHKNLVDIHPFIDGNGRTARLLMNLFLLQNNYSITIIPPLYRLEYISLVKKSQLDKKNTQEFIAFLSCMVFESTQDFYRLVKG